MFNISYSAGLQLTYSEKFFSANALFAVVSLFLPIAGAAILLLTEEK
jgi:hypothetical protein